jgi:hypothetical protein
MLARSITNQWYDGEINSFLPSYYGQPTPDMSNFEAWGHFTQVVWKGSATTGCASQYCPSGTIFTGFASWFTVCNYVAPGMFIPHPFNERQYNELIRVSKEIIWEILILMLGDLWVGLLLLFNFIFDFWSLFPSLPLYSTYLPTPFSHIYNIVTLFTSVSIPYLSTLVL